MRMMGCGRCCGTCIGGARHRCGNGSRARSIRPGTTAADARQRNLPTRTSVLYEVGEFVELARAGSYIAGDRRVPPKERTRWRLTFWRLAADAQSALALRAR